MHLWVLLARFLPVCLMLGGPERANSNLVLVIEEADREILSAAAFRAIPMPLSLMTFGAKNAWRGHYSIQNQLRATAALAPQVKRKFLMTFLANHLGVVLIKSPVHAVPTIWVSHAPPFWLGLHIAWLSRIGHSVYCSTCDTPRRKHETNRENTLPAMFLLQAPNSGF